MKIVGEKLEHIALTETDSVKKDLFGRSAFNRFYYASFLVTRDMLGALDTKWKDTKHSAIPDLLENSVRKPVIASLRKNLKKGLITKGQFSSMKSELTIASTELANLLRCAYDIRVIADYEPEYQITFSGSVISLNSLKLTTARTWTDKANAYCKSIRKVWVENGLA